MPRKKRNRRRNRIILGMQAEVWQDLAALLIFLVFIFVTMSLITPDLAGSSSRAVNDFLIRYAGLAAYPLPLLILMAGLAALPLRAQQALIGYSWKLAVLDLVFCLLAGYFFRGGEGGNLAWSYAQPALGFFYPVLLSFLLVGLIIAFAGRGFLLPALRYCENFLDDLRNEARQRAAAAELKRRREMLEAEAANEYVDDDAALPEEPTDEPVQVHAEGAEKPSAVEGDVDKAAAAAEPPKVGQQAFRFAAAYEDYQFPPLGLLSDFPFSAVAEDILQRNAQVIVETLKAFNIESEVSCWEIGPRVTRFELRIAPGINVSRLHALADNLALELAVPAVRLETPIPGKSAVGIEVPNRKFNKIALRSLLESAELKSKTHPLAVPIGRDIAGKPVIGNIHDMHHLLVAGSTGSGKSVCLNAILVSLMYRNSPASLRLILIDPKRVEMSVFKDTPHLAAPIVHDINEAQNALKWVVAEMESRLRAFEEHGVRNIDGYNDKPPESGPLPYILVVVDELADLIKAAGPVFERLIGRIAHLARATGIHLIVATQRPDAKIITGNIKMNIPSRIAFAVVSQIDSRTIIDMPGAEKLLGSGDMLYFPVGIPKPLRVQGAWVRDEEVKRVAEFLRKQTKPDYIEDITAFGGDSGDEDWDGNGEGGGGNELDELYGDAMDIITRAGRASTSLLQRRLKIGYNRAARIMEQMEQQGVVSPADHQGNRELLIAQQPKDDEDY
jgi:DNA segregation ATPase FtsK/SpoIIIE, S-DNA-T family